jgi:ABC-type glycerol-3-phosphate transport system permease component
MAETAMLLMKKKRSDLPIHCVLIVFAALTLLPFVFVVNNSFRRTHEQYRSFFGMPEALRNFDFVELTRGYVWCWEIFRPYMLNSLFVSLSSALGVVIVGSISAYVFSRYRFRGHRLLFLCILSFMMIPGVLTLVPSFLWVKKLGLINSYWVLILPYIAGGQIIAIFLMKGFFDGLPQELFESARLDGAGHFAQYWHIVLPLSKQILAVVVIVNILGTWNNFLWPQVANSDSSYAVVSTGLYLMAHTQQNAFADKSTMYAAYVISAIPLLILFVYATKPFMTGVTSGAFKA